MDWMQVGTFIVAVLGLGLAGVVYITRQLNRQFDRIDDRFKRVDNSFDRVNDRFDRVDARITRLEERMGSLEQWQARADERFDRVETRLDRLEERLDEGLQDVRGDLQNLGIEQARMLGFLEGRGVMGKAPPEPETAT
ncbi:MAG: hypothetical protein OXG84_17410 [Chloroflexi bacterium]|nr:hypothetical protein [Chloroflexota bacterium]